MSVSHVGTMLKTAKNKVRAKSTKDKTRNTPSHQPFNISGPAATVVRQAGEGLYLKLTQHQKSIAIQIKHITSALQDNGHTQYRSRHKKVDLTSVVSALLVQLDCAVTTAHQCLPKDLLEKDSTIRPKLEESEKKMFQEIASIVRWIDFDSRGAKRDMTQERDKITNMIKLFEVSLAEVVKLIYQCQQQGEVSSGSPRQRRSSIDTGVINSIQRQNSGGVSSGIAGSPVHTAAGMDELLVQRGHPIVEQLKGDRKTSWAPGMNSQAGAFRHKASTLMPHSRDSGLSEGSSGGASDEEKRRSGSSDHYLSGGMSPEHSIHHRESMSPDWDSRMRSMTTPNDLGHFGTTVTPIPVVTPTVPEYSLPPLPGELYDTPPPLPRREDEEEKVETRPPLPLKKDSSLPRVNGSLQVNGHLSPDPIPDHTHLMEEEVPPPVPIKKRHLSLQVDTMTKNNIGCDNVEETPPPLPVKVRRVTTCNQRTSYTSPASTPNHTPSHTYHQLGDELLAQGLLGDLPPVPLRMESIPGVKTVLGQDTPPPKPPRNDRPISTEIVTPQQVRPPLYVSQEMEALNAIRKYNEDIRKAQDSGPDAVPPVPLKKKTIMIYKGLVQGYTYDESIMQPLYIPGMEAPPPIPPKKRRRRKQPVAEAPSDLSSSQTLGLTQKSKLNASTDELYNEDLDEGVEVNYLECEETSGYLIFNKEESGGYTLKGGPVDALIAYAASSAKSVKHYSEAFLLTYYTFITPEELIKKLLYRLAYFYQSKTLAVWQATTSLLVRVLTGLKQPLSKEVQVELINIIHQMITNGDLKFAQLTRNSLVDKLNQQSTEGSSSIPLGLAFQTKNTHRKMSIMDFTADSIARQMTILDNELFQKVDVCEMLYWAKEQSEEKSPMLTQFTLHFNNVSQWTKVTLLKRGLDMKVRCKIMNHFIAIMKTLLENYNNFNSYLAILSAIESSPISRLDWPDKILKGLEEPRQLIDNRGSFKNYREAFSQAKPPCIPYIGLYLQDLTFIEMQPSKLEEDPSSINFTKRWKQFKSVDHIRFAQTKQYTYDPDPELLSLFKNFEVKESDEDLWVISTEIKPSQRNPRT